MKRAPAPPCGVSSDPRRSEWHLARPWSWRDAPWGLLALLAVSCAVPGVTAPVPEPAAYSVAPGESFEVRLSARPSTGYAWQLGAPLDQAVVREVSSSFVAAPGDTASRSGTSVWTFAGVEPGRTEVLLVYRRSGEAEVAPAKVTMFSVEVRDAE